MGGWGSGRSGGRPIAEEALFVDIAFMVRTRRAVPGSWISGTLSWTCNGEPSGWINYRCDMTDLENAKLQLTFTTKNRWSGEKRDYKQDVPLSYTVPHFGGRRWWMHCPVNGQRVGKLYCPAGGDIFASRTAWRLGYRSQRESERDKPFSRLNKLQRRLGCREGCEEFIYRPKGMWRRTFERHEKRYWELRNETDYQFCLMAERIRRMA